MTRRLALTVAALLVVAGTAAAQGVQGDARVRRELRRAESLERLGQLSQALAVLQIVLEQSPAEPGAVLAVERIYRRQGRLARLLPVLDRALRVDPASGLLWGVKLRVLADLGRRAELREAGELWLNAAPRSETPYREFASALRRARALRDAEDVLLRGRRKFDRPDALAVELADLYLEQGRWSAAAAEWIRVLDVSPDLGRSLVNLKLQSLGPGASSAAEALLSALAERQPSAGERELAAVAALYADRPEEARRHAGAALLEMEAAQRQRFITQFARVAAKRAQPALVAWAYRRLLPDVADDSTRWGLARQIVSHDLSAGDTAAALNTVGDVLARARPGTPSHRWAFGLRVRLYAAQTAAERAERAFQRYVRLYSNDAELPRLALAVAEADVRRGRLEAASRALDAVSEVGRPAVAARISAACGYLALYAGRHDEARSEFEVAAASLSGEERSEALRFLGFLRDANERELAAIARAHRSFVQGRRLEAFELLMDGLGRVPASSARPGLLLWAGEQAIAGAAVDRAEAVLRSIPELYPRSGEAPVALMALAEALAGVGRKPAATELLETLILDYPESALTPIGRRRLAELREEVPRS